MNRVFQFPLTLAVSPGGNLLKVVSVFAGGRGDFGGRRSWRVLRSILSFVEPPPYHAGHHILLTTRVGRAAEAKLLEK